MKKIIFLIIAIVLIIVGVMWSRPNNHSFKDITYQIDGVSMFLNGNLHYFGNEATGDLNGDGLADTAFLIVQNSTGSGVFYYLVAALKTPNGYQGTNAIFLGDRIAPQTTEIQNGQIIVNYADRKLNEPMTAQPSVGVSKYVKILDGKLVVIGR